MTATSGARSRRARVWPVALARDRLDPAAVVDAPRLAAIEKRTRVRQRGELRRSLRIGGRFVITILIFTGIVMAARVPQNGPLLLALWFAAAGATATLTSIARRAHRSAITTLTIAFTILPVVCLAATFTVAPQTILMMDSGFVTLPVSIPLFLNWPATLRRAWLVGYAVIVGGLILLTGFGHLATSARVDLLSNIVVGCLIGAVGGELLGRMRAQTAAHAYDLRRANLRLRAYATTDPLTGLANRRQLEDDVATLTAAHGKHGQPCSLVLLDLDHFKLLNDARGHAAGDEALRAVASELRHLVRAPDSAYRYGGEEFLLILPETALVEAAAVAERIRRSVAALDIARSADGHTSLTVSCGVAEWRSPETTFERSLADADAALYEAKAAGRDSVATRSSVNQPVHLPVRRPARHPARRRADRAACH
jgi:diguanylate cyclase (GGDEF)-like protein